MNNISDTEFYVVDGFGSPWVTLCYREMAESVAARCNQDWSLRGQWPFKVLSVTAEGRASSAPNDHAERGL
jgi:hypothetical protein